VALAVDVEADHRSHPVRVMERRLPRTTRRSKPQCLQLPPTLTVAKASEAITEF
jgi:hypothetical protein